MAQRRGVRVLVLRSPWFMRFAAQDGTQTRHATSLKVEGQETTSCGTDLPALRSKTMRRWT